eukprot:1160840-Pelagomonas_calceolata.AAC.5
MEVLSNGEWGLPGELDRTAVQPDVLGSNGERGVPGDLGQDSSTTSCLWVSFNQGGMRFKKGL